MVAMLPLASAEDSVKKHVVDNVPKRIKEIRFGILSSRDIVNQGVLEICERNLYDVANSRRPVVNGALDGRLGTTNKNVPCETCGDTLNNCNGHFGHVKLALPAFHIGYFKAVITILQCICKDCARVLLKEPERRTYLRQLRTPYIDNLRRTQICRAINDQCRKARTCPHCGAINGVVKKAGALKIIHDKFRTFNISHAAKKKPPPSKVEFDESFTTARKLNHELDKHMKKAMDDLNPLKVINLFKQITPNDCELLGMNPSEGRPEMFIWQYIPAPPVAIRPSVAQETASTEDDLTVKLADIVHISSLLRAGLQRGQTVQTIMEQWEFMQLQIAMYINSDLPGLSTPFGKPIRGLCQRLKGKQGRFRGNLSGKRVDFSGRTVISPDPNLSIDQVAVPILVAKNLTYPEKVSKYNLEKLRQRVHNGVETWPGANFLLKNGAEYKTYLKFDSRHALAEKLEDGDVVERHLEDDDIVLFNRQPSLHKLSIMAHYVKVRPWRTFRLNECVCTPYNADFDGDEMNLHVPQTEEARTEARELMGVKYNLITPKNGEPIIAATQDFILAAYLISSRDTFFNRKVFTYLCMSMVDGNMQIDLPPPAIWKPEQLWTGKQVFNVIMRPNKASPVLVNLEARCKDYKNHEPRDLCPNDGWLIVRNSEVLCGSMDKSTIGSGKKDSIFYVILRDFGPDHAVQAMNRLTKLSARWLTNQGFSIGISDVYPGESLRKLKHDLVERAYAECDDVISRYREGKLEKATGCNAEQTMENRISGILSKVREQAGDYCIKELSRWNSPLIMANSGAKGSKINVSQMVAVVGQQIIGDKRVADGFQDRTLPHFPKNARSPPSKGFVRNSFFSGLTPTEFLFHAISGREGLVDTAVKTAETGYMSRRLMKSLEDLSTQYDNTVRNSSSGIVQFQYGDDKLDPADMEGSAKPVHFIRTFTHAQTITWNNDDPGLRPYEIVLACEEMLFEERRKLARKSFSGEILAYEDDSDENIDEHDSARDFLQSIQDFVKQKAVELSKIRNLYGLMGFLEDPKGTDYDGMDEDPLNEPVVVAVDQVLKVSLPALAEFIKLCLSKYERAKVEPGSAVGPIGAQSIGEPGTQMTLKTFHFAGVAGMSVTQGVPRIKEIINASKKISTPIINCVLEHQNVHSARVVKARIEKTYLSDIIHYIEDTFSEESSYVQFRVDLDTIKKLHLNISLTDISKAIIKTKLKVTWDTIRISKDRIRIYVFPLSYSEMHKTKDETDTFLRVQNLKRALPQVVVKGYPDAARAVINTDPQTLKASLLVEGYGLKACMNTLGVVGIQTKTNSITEMREVLGIEAARKSIINEISAVMDNMEIDPRHMQLLADVMTYKGEILGITRFGMAKMRDSVLQLASFEKTPDHLFEASFHMKKDSIEGVSECIIMGQSMKVGTGAFQVVRTLNMNEGDLTPKPTVFENVWSEIQNARKGGRRGLTA